MPITLDHAVRILSQDQFGAIAYELMGHAFAIHKEMGRFFDEDVYRNEIFARFGNRAEREFYIRFEHAGFRKPYFIDLLIDGGAVFEFKTVSQLAEPHRNQLIQYLMLTELRHGKLLNFRPDKVEHEFINCGLTHARRREFLIITDNWNPATSLHRQFHDGLIELLNDWGTGLDFHLYEEVIAHPLGGLDQVARDVDVIGRGERIGSKRANLLDPVTAFKITSLREDLDSYRSHLLRLLNHTNLSSVFWANITLGEVRLNEVRKPD